MTNTKGGNLVLVHLHRQGKKIDPKKPALQTRERKLSTRNQRWQLTQRGSGMKNKRLVGISSPRKTRGRPKTSLTGGRPQNGLAIAVGGKRRGEFSASHSRKGGGAWDRVVNRGKGRKKRSKLQKKIEKKKKEVVPGCLSYGVRQDHGKKHPQTVESVGNGGSLSKKKKGRRCSQPFTSLNKSRNVTLRMIWGDSEGTGEGKPTRTCLSPHRGKAPRSSGGSINGLRKNPKKRK